MSSIPTDQLARRFAFASTFLRLFGAVAAVFAFFVFVARGAQIIRAAPPEGWTAWSGPVAWLFAAVVAWAGLAGLAAIVEIMRSAVVAAQHARERDMLGPVLYPPPAPPNHEAAPQDAHHLDRSSAAESRGREALSPEVMDLFREIRDNLLLSEGQRAEKRVRMVEEEIAKSRRTIRDLLGNGQFVRARRIVEELGRRFPDRAEAAEMGAEIETARARAEAADVASYSKRVEELMSISAWDRAAEAARELLERHPGSDAAKKLVDRISRERELFVGEQQRRMYAEIQRYVSRRRWREALVASRTFVEKFPELPDSETLRAQLPTLQANAEIEERQELEAQITDLAKHARYIEAYNLARHLIDCFPDSPQADALRNQLPRLKELAHDPHATPARVRIET